MVIPTARHRNVFILLLLLSGGGEIRSQILSPELWRGAAVGGLIGGILGHNSNRHTAEGIGIGAASGALLGAMTREHETYDTYIPSRSRSLRADAPHARHRPHHALSGAVVGAVAGCIIGHQNGGRSMEGAGIGTVGGAAIGALAEHLQRNGANRHHFAPEAPPRHSILYHSNPPAPLPIAFARPIRTRETRNGAVITTSRPAMETGSTLIRAVPDHTRTETATDPRSRGIEFKYLGHGPGKQKGCEPESSRP